MDNKYFKFIVQESPLLKKGTGVLIALIIIAIQAHFICLQKSEIARRSDEKILVARIPSMEIVLRNRDKKVLTNDGAENTRGKNLHMEGIAVNAIAPAVIINNQVYEVGDFYDDYKIIKISREGTILLNEKTNELRNLYFSLQADSFDN